jgi:hypothetical protein
VLVPLADAGEDVQTALESARDPVLSPAASELMNGSMCSALGLGTTGAMLLRFCGNEPGVRKQLSHLGAGEPAPFDIWDRLQIADGTGPAHSGESQEMVVRISARPSLFLPLWQFAISLATELTDTRLQASVGRGVVRVHIPARWASRAVAVLRSRPSGSALVLETVPAELWKQLAPDLVANAELSSKVRHTYDPHRMFNPGIMWEGNR